MQNQKHSFRLLNVKLHRIVSSIQIHLEAITYSMSQSSNTIELTIQNYLQIRKIISMALRIFGTKPSVICVDLMAFQERILYTF